MKRGRGRPKKIHLEFLDEPVPLTYGGSLRRRANGRGARPLSRSKPIHLVLRSTAARGKLAFNRFGMGQNYNFVTDTVYDLAKVHGVKIDRYGNAGNHIHLLIRLAARHEYKSFIRALTGTLALMIPKRAGLKVAKGKFWDERPFSRVVLGRRGAEIADKYVILNHLEGMGVLPYSEARSRGLSRDLLEDYGVMVGAIGRRPRTESS